MPDLQSQIRAAILAHKSHCKWALTELTVMTGKEKASSWGVLGNGSGLGYLCGVRVMSQVRSLCLGA